MLDDLVADDGDGVEHRVGGELAEQRTARDARGQERTEIHAHRADEQRVEHLGRAELGEQRPQRAPRPPPPGATLAAPLRGGHDAVEADVLGHRAGDRGDGPVARDPVREPRAGNGAHRAHHLGRQIAGTPFPHLAQPSRGTRDRVRQPALLSLAGKGQHCCDEEPGNYAR
jgi:hypothetical protein